MATGDAEFIANHSDGGDDVEGGGKVIVKTKSGLDQQKTSLAWMFDRSSSSWWNPKFDSEILELEFQKRMFPQLRKRFRVALIYILVAFAVWSIFFLAVPNLPDTKYSGVIGGAVFFILILVILIFTLLSLYRKCLTLTSVCLTVLLMVSCLLTFAIKDVITEVGTFCSLIEIVLMMYTMIPLPLYMCFSLGIVLSVLFEILTGALLEETHLDDAYYHIVRVLLHCCVHFIGVYICVMTQVRRRSTFLKVGQAILSRRDLETEKNLKKTMINSLMPEKVAQEVLSKKGEKGGGMDDDDPRASPKKRHSKAVSPARGQITFRNFHMTQMNEVSILFADIVGFTKMSSNKTAEHLVSLLNDLFGKFDIICEKTGCEKICTLGDCYYSVSGCPDSKPDHAKCCVEMGLSMCVAIQEFDKANNEEVNMRVGVHTGMVLCGLVGTRRFKFDVWSHDVTIANTMESDGRPGRVHISDSTYQFVKDDYAVEPGDEIADIRKHKTLIEYYNTEKQGYDIKHVQDKDTIKTWFITERKSGIPLTTPLRDMISGSDDVTIQVTNDHAANSKADKQDEDEDSKNHKESQADGVPTTTTALLAKRDNEVSAMEELTTTGADDVKKHLQYGGPSIEKDKEIVTCMRKDSQVEEYLYNPPINRCTLSFRDADTESHYRHHYLDDKYQSHQTSKLSRPRFSALLDVIVSFIYFLLISVCCFLAFSSADGGVRVVWLVFFLVALVLEVVLMLPLIANVCLSSGVGGKSVLLRMCNTFLLWYPRHVIGAVVSSLPVAAVYCNVSGSTELLLFSLTLMVALLHYCNFTMLVSALKSALAILAGILLVCVIMVFLNDGVTVVTTAMPFNASTSSFVTGNATTESSSVVPVGTLNYEIILNVFLVLTLIVILNREFEINYRLTFHGDMLAEEDKRKTQEEKDTADWLLHNIIPEHVASVMKETQQYCKNHDEVGVVFAKIVNYDDFYDESYEGGKEYLRVLNEMMGDFEDLFDDPRFKDVEKIKTIGSCLMVASGLNPTTRSKNQDPKAHLYALMEFCMELLKKLDEFNAEIFNFNFNMAIGFNSGPVTAGVIGTTKLLYDIWGDTVNVSSRMYSTGVPGKIQATEECSKKVEEMFNFEYRGQTYVKGKGDLNTYLLTDMKPGATWN